MNVTKYKWEIACVCYSADIYIFLIIVDITTPIAIIVCEGDIQTISHISKALRKQLPVIIMKGSGKATDVVLEYLEKY